MSCKFEVLCVGSLGSAEAATGRRTSVPLSGDSADRHSSSPTAERNRSFQLKCSWLTEKEFLFGVRKLIFSGMHGFHFSQKPPMKNVTFEFIFYCSIKFFFICLFLIPQKKWMNNIIHIFLVLNNNTWNCLTVCKQKRFGLFKNSICNHTVYKSSISYICINRIWC